MQRRCSSPLRLLVAGALLASALPRALHAGDEEAAARLYRGKAAILEAARASWVDPQFRRLAEHVAKQQARLQREHGGLQAAAHSSHESSGLQLVTHQAALPTKGLEARLTQDTPTRQRKRQSMQRTYRVGAELSGPGLQISSLRMGRGRSARRQIDLTAENQGGSYSISRTLIPSASGRRRARKQRAVETKWTEGLSRARDATATLPTIDLGETNAQRALAAHVGTLRWYLDSAVGPTVRRTVGRLLGQIDALVAAQGTTVTIERDRTYGDCSITVSAPDGRRLQTFVEGGSAVEHVWFTLRQADGRKKELTLFTRSVLGDVEPSAIYKTDTPVAFAAGKGSRHRQYHFTRTRRGGQAAESVTRTLTVTRPLRDSELRKLGLPLPTAAAQ